jgi:LacI family kdg operon repressor
MGKQAAKTLLSSIEEGGESVPIIYRFVPDINRGESVKTL